MPFFLKPEAGSGVSELLDDRLENLKLELKASEKTCQALLPNVAAFTKGTREMCRGAGNAASAFGAALQVDSARTGATEKHPTARAAHDRDVDGGGSDVMEGAGAESLEEAETASRKGGSSLGGVGESEESMRAELLALQLVECANEMEEYVKAQVVQPIERVLASRSDIKAAIRERSQASDVLATAHSDYAKSVARYQSSGDNFNGGPPLEVVQAGDRVVWASDAFAEAHGRAEEALTELLEERGRCLREAASSLKAAQAGFFVRASRCVSSSVVWESTDGVLSRVAEDVKHPDHSAREDAGAAPVASDSATAAAASTDSGHEEGGEDAGNLPTGSAGYDLENINTVKGKWKKGGHHDGMRIDSSKRRRNSGWFKRLASSFQTSGPSSASDELRERMSSTQHEAADHEDSFADGQGKRPATMPSAATSRGRSLFGGNDDWKEKAPPPNGRGIELEEWNAAPSSIATRAREFAPESARLAAREGGNAAATRVDGAEVPAEAEEDESDYETGSNTTEGFGSDDAGDLWDERRSTLMGPLGRISFMPSGNGMGGGAFPTEEKVDHVERTPGARLGEVEAGEVAGEVQALIDLGGETTEGPVTSPALDGDTRVSAVPADEAEKAPKSPSSVKNIGDHLVEECGGDQGDVDGSAAVVEGKFSDFSSPVPTPRSYYFSNVSPSTAPASILPKTPEARKKDDQDKEEPLPPVTVEQQTPSPFSRFVSSPPISDGSGCKESPRAWRLSWWARASDRHPPPPPPGDGENEEAGGSTGTSFAAALAGAAAGGEEAAATLPAGGTFAPSFNAGDAPAVVDGGDKRDSARRRSVRRRRDKPWLSKDKLADTQARPLEAASEFLDVAGLGRSGLVCRAWREPLSGEAGRRRWMRCVRLVDGVPEKWRAKFYLHILYDQPSWVQKAHGSSSTEHPRPGVYQECLAKAEEDEEETRAAKENQSISEEEERGGRTSPAAREDNDESQGSGASPADVCNKQDNGVPPPSPKCHSWLEEIETDVLRTCPGDKSAVEDAADEFDTAISHRNTPADAGDATETGDSSPTVGASASVRFSIPDASRGGSDGAVDSVDGSSGAVEMSPVAASEGSAPTEGKGVSAQGVLATNPGTRVEVLSGHGRGGERRRRTLTVTGGGTRDKLRRVLRAFAVYNRRVSYCQGMNFVALALLEACGGDDENAFWILAGMCENLELEGLWCQGLERLDLCFFSLERLLRRHCPSLRQHLSDEGVELSMFTSRWFVTLFTSTDVFGRGTSRKILDMFMVEGWPLLFKMSLGVLLEMRPLLEPVDMEGILKVTKFPRAHLFGLRRDGSGRHIAGASFEEATQGSLCESIRAGQMVEHALMLHISEETLEQHRQEYRLQKHAEPGSD